MESISNVASVGGGGGSEYTAGNGINISDQDEISTDNLQSGDINEIVTPLPYVIPALTNSKIEKNMVWVQNKPCMALSDIHVYVNPQTGVNNYSAGYGFSAAKPFASIDYALPYLPKMSIMDNAGKLAYTITMHLYGTHTSSSIVNYNIEFPNSRIYIIIEEDVVFNNVTLLFVNCIGALLRLNGNLTINITNTSFTSTTKMIAIDRSASVIFDAPNATAQSQKALILNGNSTKRSLIRGIECAISKLSFSAANTYLEANYCDIVVNNANTSQCYIANLKGANNNIILNCGTGSVLAYGNNNASGTTAQRTMFGGRIYTGA